MEPAPRWTRRLTLVPHRAEDLRALCEGYERYARSFGMPAAEGLRDFIVSPEVSADFQAMLQAAAGADPWRFGFGLVHQHDRVVVGVASFKGPPDSTGVVEIAYGIVPGYQNCGLATEAAAALVEFAAAHGGHQVCAHTLPQSNASTRVLEKCGFALVGEVIDPDDGPVWRWERAADAP